MNIQNLKDAAGVLLISALINACSSAPKAFIPSDSDLASETQKLEVNIQKGQKNHYDVLATSDFNKSKELLKEAQEQLNENDDREDILETLSEAKGYFNRASQTANNRSDRVQGLLKAREAAIIAGARNYSDQSEILQEIDEDLIDEVEDGDDISSETFRELQTRYVTLEVSTTQTAQLAEARKQIATYRDDAEDNAPQTLENADKHMATAETTIAANVRNPKGYAMAVARANASADFLADVVRASERNGEVLPEAVAIDLVKKGRINESQQARLSRQSQSLKYQQKISEIAQSFNKDEAEVYKQDDNILIRLKGMNFPTGRAELPGDSVALLQKVSQAASTLNAKHIVVEGHTDSTGSSDTNQKLSEDRAKSVAQYLTSNGVDRESVEVEGYGFKKPLASNKTKDGRAMNRRVDIIITPSSQNGGMGNSASLVR